MTWQIGVGSRIQKRCEERRIIFFVEMEKKHQGGILIPRTGTGVRMLEPIEKAFQLLAQGEGLFVAIIISIRVGACLKSRERLNGIIGFDRRNEVAVPLLLTDDLHKEARQHSYNEEQCQEGKDQRPPLLHPLFLLHLNVSALR